MAKACDFGWLKAAVLAMVFLVCGAVVPGEEGAETAVTGERGSWSDYSLIAQRNIFSRNRGRRAAPRSRNDAEDLPQRAAAPPAESYMVLKGIVAAGTTFAAFIEDTRTGEVHRVGSGAAIARGTVKIESLDTLAFRQEDKELRVAVGQTLAGGSSRTVLTLDNIMQWSASAPAVPVATTPAPASEDEAEMLRRLLERRRQQLGE